MKQHAPVHKASQCLYRKEFSEFGAEEFDSTQIHQTPLGLIRTPTVSQI